MTHHRCIVAILLLAVSTAWAAGSNGKAKSGAPAATATPPPSPPAQAKSETPTPQTQKVTVTRETLHQVIPTMATFRAKQATKLGSQVAGRVEAVLVDVGSKVKKGQELVRLERNFFEIELAQRKSELESAQVMLADAKVKLARAQGLWGNGKNPSVSRQFLDDAHTALDLAQTHIHQSEQGIRFAEERLKETVIRAPYDATVTERMVHPGEPVQAMFVTPLLEIQEIDSLELIFSLPQETLSRVREGMTVLYRVEGLEGAQGIARLDTIFPALNEATRSVTCRAWITNTGLKLRPHLLAQVGVVEREIPNALVLPKSALTQTLSGYQVTVIANDQPVVRPVKIGLVSMLDKAEVLEGLNEGDQVLVTGKSL